MYGYLRVATVFPEIKIGDVNSNKNNILAEIEKLKSENVKIILFPELCITSNSLYDVFFDDDILLQAKEAIIDIANFTEDMDTLIIVSMPYKYKSKIYDVSVYIKSGEILAIVPRRYIRDSKVISDRQFSDGKGIDDLIDIDNEKYKNIIFSDRVVLNLKDYGFISLSVNFDEELDNYLKTNIVLNPSSMNENIHIENDILMLKVFSANEKCAVINSSPSYTESSSRFIFFSRSYIYECGELINKNDNLSKNSIITDIDIDILLNQEKKEEKRIRNIKNIDVSFYTAKYEHMSNIYREVSKTPYIYNGRDSFEYSNRIINMLAVALMKRINVTHAKNMVIGLSGGLDSTFALLICNKTRSMLKNFDVNIVAVTMPGFGTSKKSLSNVKMLCDILEIKLKVIDITESVEMHFRDIQHNVSNVNSTYENAQARERTQILMDIANDEDGIVVGTSDMSEEALGFSTYNGDQMSMYNLISSVPKTLIRYVINSFVESYKIENENFSNVLKSILETPISPELLPIKDENVEQKTEEIIGDYILHDFFLFYYLKYKFSIEKIYDLSLYAFRNTNYDSEYIKNTIKTFFDRFYKAQYKRNASADSPSIGIPNLDKNIGYVTVSDLEIWKKI